MPYAAITEPSSPSPRNATNAATSTPTDASVARPRPQRTNALQPNSHHPPPQACGRKIRQFDAHEPFELPIAFVKTLSALSVAAQILPHRLQRSRPRARRQAPLQPANPHQHHRQGLPRRRESGCPILYRPHWDGVGSAPTSAPGAAVKNSSTTNPRHDRPHHRIRPCESVGAPHLASEMWDAAAEARKPTAEAAHTPPPERDYTPEEQDY